MRALVMEDDPKTASFLKKGLEENGFVVDVASNGVDGLFMAREAPYALLIVDAMMPGTDGWEVIRQFRRDGGLTPILMLTARDTVADRVKGLDLGADDYLIKPFAFTELLARARSLLRRPPIKHDEVLRVADLEIDVLRRVATRQGNRLRLTPKEFALLLLLVQRCGEPVSRTVLAELVWDINFDSDTNVVDVAVKRLRAKVDDPFKNKLIHTVRGVGYVLESR